MPDTKISNIYFKMFNRLAQKEEIIYLFFNFS